MSRFKLGGRPPPVEEPVVARPPTGEGPPTGRPIDIENARFAQEDYGEKFSAKGKFAGRTIDDVAKDLRSGALSPKDVKIEVIARDGNDLILNTRSSQALERAGIPRSEWDVVDVTGNPGAESRLTNQTE